MLHHALCAVTAASRLTQAVREKFVKGSEIIKADMSPVTVGDFGVQALISLFLMETGQGSALRLVAEEDPGTLQRDPQVLRIVTELVNRYYPLPGRAFTGDQVIDALSRGADAGGARGAFWMLDPIDGTKGFVRGGQYAVGLGRIEAGALRLAAIACPSLPPLGHDPVHDVSGPGYVFGACEGWAGMAEIRAARHVTPDQPASRWRQHVLAPLAPRACTELVTTESFERPCCGLYPCLAHARRCAIDSMAKYCVVARGDCAIYVRKSARGHENIWDHAAALVVTAAGGRVTDFTGAPLCFGRGRALAGNVGVVASGPGWGALHDTLLDEMRAQE